MYTYVVRDVATIPYLSLAFSPSRGKRPIAASPPFYRSLPQPARIKASARSRWTQKGAARVVVAPQLGLGGPLGG